MTDEQQPLIALGRTVREMRREQQRTVRDLAAEIPIEPRELDAIEAGRLDPDYKLLRALCRALGVPAGEFFTRVERLTRAGTGR